MKSIITIESKKYLDKFYFLAIIRLNVETIFILDSYGSHGSLQLPDCGDG